MDAPETATCAAVLPNEAPNHPPATSGAGTGVTKDTSILNSRRDAFAEQARLEAEWRKIWQGERPVGTGFSETTQCLGLLPAFPAATPWSGCKVLQTLKAMARGKAPGLDEWRVAGGTGQASSTPAQVSS